MLKIIMARLIACGGTGTENERLNRTAIHHSRQAKPMIRAGVPTDPKAEIVRFAGMSMRQITYKERNQAAPTRSRRCGGRLRSWACFREPVLRVTVNQRGRQTPPQLGFRRQAISLRLIQGPVPSGPVIVTLSKNGAAAQRHQRTAPEAASL